MASSTDDTRQLSGRRFGGGLPVSMVVRVVAPSGRDGSLIVALLTQNRIEAEVCADIAFLLSCGHDVGPLMIAEESLTTPLIAALARFVSTQPSWSDLPILILTTTGRDTERTRRLERERLPIGAPVLLERPVRTATLLSSVKAALRARGRQYEVRDIIAERDRAAVELRAEQALLRTILDSMPVGVAVARDNGEVVLTNPTLSRILRHEQSPTPDFSAYRKWPCFHPDGTQLQPEEYPLARAIRTGEPVAGEDYLYQRGDGTSAWIRLSAAPIFAPNAEVSGGITAVIDIDRERRAAEAVRRSEERFRVLIEQASVGIVIGDLSGRLTYMNPTLLRTLGYTQAEMEAGFVRWDKLTPPEYAALDAQAVMELQTVGVAQPYQKVYIARDGHSIPLLVGAVRIPSSDRENAGEIAVFLTDLSSQKQAELALIQSEKLAAVGRLASSISHEINNPLEAVTNLLFIARNEPLLPTVHHYLELAEQELARVSQIAGQTLRFHRQSTKPRSVTPQELIEPVLALYAGRLRNAHVRAVSEHRDEPSFICYEGDIRQVLNNLVGNAIDAMRGDGTLRLRSRAAVDRRTGRRGVRITVADSGSGMSRDTLSHIFEPFFTTKGIHGTGLGLWISRGIVEKQNGTLRVRSRMDDEWHGTVFSLFLPLSADLPSVD